jgi:hypothetical protein
MRNGWRLATLGCVEARACAERSDAGKTWCLASDDDAANTQLSL